MLSIFLINCNQRLQLFFVSSNMPQCRERKRERVCSLSLDYTSLLWPRTLSSAITSPYRGRAAEFARPILRIRNCRRSASCARSRRVPRIRAYCGGNCSRSFLSRMGIKSREKTADSSAAAREGKCPFASRFCLREILPSPRLLLAAPAVVAFATTR